MSVTFYTSDPNSIVEEIDETKYYTDITFRVRMNRDVREEYLKFQPVVNTNNYYQCIIDIFKKIGLVK